MIDPKLISLVKVYETGSFTRAAEQLSLTQPAVSQHISALEKNLGIKIFERANNALRVTREGELAVMCARRMLALYQNLQQQLKSERMQIKYLTVGITHTAESNPIAETLAKCVERYSDITIKIVTNTSDNLHSMLKNYELDFAVVEGKFNDSSLNHIVLDTDTLVLAVSPSHPLARHSIVTIDELKKEKLILRSPSSNTRNLFVSSLASQNMRIEEFNVIMEIDNIATIKDLIRRGFGVSVLPQSVCLDELRKKKIVCLPIEDLSMVREINLVYSRHFEHPELLHEIVQDYKEVRGSLTPQSKT